MKTFYLFLFVGLISNPVFAQNHFPDWSLLEYQDANWYGMSKDCRKDLQSLLNPALIEIDAFAFYISTPKPNTIVVEYRDLGFLDNENEHFVIEFEDDVLQSSGDPIQNAICSYAIENAQITRVYSPLWFHRKKTDLGHGSGFANSIFWHIEKHTFEDITSQHFNAKDKAKLLKRYHNKFEIDKEQIHHIKLYQSIENPRVVIVSLDYDNRKHEIVHVFKKDVQHLNKQNMFTSLINDNESLLIPFPASYSGVQHGDKRIRITKKMPRSYG